MMKWVRLTTEKDEDSYSAEGKSGSWVVKSFTPERLNTDTVPPPSVLAYAREGESLDSNDTKNLSKSIVKHRDEISKVIKKHWVARRILSDKTTTHHTMQNAMDACEQEDDLLFKEKRIEVMQISNKNERDRELCYLTDIEHSSMLREIVSYPLDIPSVSRQIWHDQEQPWLSDGYCWRDKPHRVIQKAMDEIRALRAFIVSQQDDQ